MNTAAYPKSNIDPVSEDIPVLLKLGSRVIEMASRRVARLCRSLAQDAILIQHIAAALMPAGP
jgi:hypothetical protein